MPIDDFRDLGAGMLRRLDRLARTDGGAARTEDTLQDSMAAFERSLAAPAPGSTLLRVLEAMEIGLRQRRPAEETQIAEIEELIGEMERFRILIVSHPDYKRPKPPPSKAGEG